jgi:hypothetical protein
MSTEKTDRFFKMFPDGQSAVDFMQWSIKEIAVWNARNNFRRNWKLTEFSQIKKR